MSVGTRGSISSLRIFGCIDIAIVNRWRTKLWLSPYIVRLPLFFVDFHVLLWISIHLSCARVICNIVLIFVLAIYATMDYAISVRRTSTAHYICLTFETFYECWMCVKMCSVLMLQHLLCVMRVSCACLFWGLPKNTRYLVGALNGNPFHSASIQTVRSFYGMYTRARQFRLNQNVQHRCRLDYMGIPCWDRA